MTIPQISSTVGQATLLTAPLVDFGEISDRIAAIVSATNPTSTSNASATTISETMPIRVRVRSRSSVVTSFAAGARRTGRRRRRSAAG